MADNFLTIVNQVLLEIDEDELTSSNFDTSTDAHVKRVKNYVKRIYKQICRMKPNWSWAQNVQTFNTVASQANYSAGPGLESETDLQKVHYARISTYPPLLLLPFEEVMQKYGEMLSTSGQPVIAYVLNQNLYLLPVPDQVYAIELVTGRVPEDLIDFSDVPLIPDRHSDVIVEGALWMAMRNDNDPEAANQYKSFQLAVKQLAAAEDNNHIGHQMKSEDDLGAAADYSIISLDSW